MSVSTAPEPADRRQPRSAARATTGFSAARPCAGRSSRCCCWRRCWPVIVRTDAGLGDAHRAADRDPQRAAGAAARSGPDRARRRQRRPRPDHHRSGAGRRRVLAVRDGAGRRRWSGCNRRTISIPYPWVEGETHAIALVSATGVLFDDRGAGGRRRVRSQTESLCALRADRSLRRRRAGRARAALVSLPAAAGAGPA